MKTKLRYLSALSFLFFAAGEDARPHIIFIYADDLGWNDVSFHGSPEIPTPNIDALAMNGILLNNYYGEYMCTPSRAALLTGKYPIRLGLQHFVIKASEKSGLPLNEIIMPQYLKSLGYATHIIGKWHLGHMTKEFTPTFRGFDSFFGYYNGILDYYDYTAVVKTDLPDKPDFHGVDLHNGTKLVKDFRGQYATHAFTDAAKSLILNHDTSKPLFLYLSHLAVHAGNKGDYLQAPPEVIRKFKYIKDINRRIQAAMTSVLDESVGSIIETLQQKNMLQNSIVVFASDNGGQINGIKGGYSSNFPLRGKKSTLWEGGIHVPALIWSPLLKLQKPQISEQLMHVTDWLPTFLNAVGGDTSEIGNIDGISMWEAFFNHLPSPRTELLHNIDSVDGVSALRSGDFKIINGSSPEGYDEWYGPKGTEYLKIPESMENWVFKENSTVRHVLTQAGMWIVGNVDEWYKKSQITCDKSRRSNPGYCSPIKRPSLFNIKSDPCELLDLAPFNPEIVDSMMETILTYQKSAMEPQSKPSDPRGNPMCYDYAFVSWMDPEYSTQYENCDFLE